MSEERKNVNRLTTILSAISTLIRTALPDVPFILIASPPQGVPGDASIVSNIEKTKISKVLEQASVLTKVAENVLNKPKQA